MIRAVGILLLCQLLGELLVRLLSLPAPGPVAGMVLLLIAFVARGGVPDDLRLVSRNLLLNLSLLFVPAGVGIMVHADRVGQEWPVLAGALFIATALTVIVTALVFRWTLHLTERGRLTERGER
jgi:holin-like protein